MLNQSREIYGLKPASNVRLWWGVRALYHNYGIEIIENKIQTVGGSLPEQTSLSDWVKSTGLPAIKRLVVEHRLGDEEERTLTYRDSCARFLIFANPKASYGYLYICATPYDPN